MGTFAETAIINYCLSFADQGKQTSFFPFLFTANKGKFAVSIFHLKRTKGSCQFLLLPFYVCGISETWRHGDGEMETWRHRRET
jgi:hypothetical protein